MNQVETGTSDFIDLMESYYRKHVQKCDGDGDVKKIS